MPVCTRPISEQDNLFILKHTHAQTGFILVTVLFFLLMLALMTISLLNATHLELRMSQNYAMASQQFWAAEAGLKMAEAELANRYKNEQSQAGFNYAGYEVQYVIRALGLPFCNNQHSVLYYRITAQAKQAERNALVLQTTYLKKTHKKCDGDKEKQLTEGRSSWRELNRLTAMEL